MHETGDWYDHLLLRFIFIGALYYSIIWKITVEACRQRGEHLPRNTDGMSTINAIASNVAAPALFSAATVAISSTLVGSLFYFAGVSVVMVYSAMPKNQGLNG